MKIIKDKKLNIENIKTKLKLGTNTNTKKRLTEISTKLISLGKKLLNHISNMLSSISTMLNNITSFLKPRLISFTSYIKDKVKAIFKAIKTKLCSFAKRLAVKVSYIIEDIGEFIKDHDVLLFLVLSIGILIFVITTSDASLARLEKSEQLKWLEGPSYTTQEIIGKPGITVKKLGYSKEGLKYLDKIQIIKEEYKDAYDEALGNFLLDGIKIIESSEGLSIVSSQNNDGNKFIITIQCSELDKVYNEFGREISEILGKHLYSEINRAFKEDGANKANEGYGYEERYLILQFVGNSSERVLFTVEGNEISYSCLDKDKNESSEFLEILPEEYGE